MPRWRSRGVIIWFLEIGHDLAEDVSDRRAEGDQDGDDDSQGEDDDNQFLNQFFRRGG